MKPISIDMVRSLACSVNEDGSYCAACLFDGYGCSSCQCSVGNVLKRLVDEGFLSIDENADTNLPKSANWSEGRDINVPTTPPSATADKMKAVQLPKWCKEGQWVMTEDGKILKIDCITGDLVSVRIPNGLAYCTSTPDLTFKPIRFREYSFEEAKGLLGKVMDYSCDNGPFSGRSEKSTLITNVSNGKYGVLINGDFFRDLSEHFNATINGIPIGVPVIDEEALKEVADGEHEL